MINYLKLMTIILFIANLIACKALEDPIYKDVSRNNWTMPEKEPVKDKEEIIKAAIIGKFMLDSQARHDLFMEIESVPFSFKVGKSGFETASDLSTGVQMTTDLFTGTVGSGQGQALGLAVGVAALTFSAFSDDGSHDVTSGIFLPAEMDGVKIDTPAQAMLIARQMVNDKIQTIAQKMNFSAACVEGCNQARSTYQLKNLDYKASTNPERYIPKEIGIYVSISPFVENEDLSKYDSLATGFKVKWMTENINGFQFVMASDNSFNNTDVKFIEGEDGLPTIFGDLRFSRTELGRKITRTLHNTPHTFFGSSKTFFDVLYFNDRVYNFYSNGRYETFRDYAKPEFQQGL